MDAAFSQMLEQVLNWKCTTMYTQFYNNLLRSVKKPEVRLTSYLLLLGHLNTCSKGRNKTPSGPESTHCAESFPGCASLLFSLLTLIKQQEDYANAFLLPCGIWSYAVIISHYLFANTNSRVNAQNYFVHWSATSNWNATRCWNPTMSRNSAALSTAYPAKSSKKPGHTWKHSYLGSNEDSHNVVCAFSCS